MPGSGDYFQQYLVDDFNTLDREMGGHQWFQKEQERETQKNLSEQNEQEKSRVEEEISDNTPTTDPFRSTYDRRKENSKESKKDRLERIKKEYEHTPFVSVGSSYIPPINWEDLRERRKKRREVQKQIIDELPKDGLAANSPGFTQMVEQNEPTIMPKTFGLKVFCKKAETKDIHIFSIGDKVSHESFPESVGTITKLYSSEDIDPGLVPGEPWYGISWSEFPGEESNQLGLEPESVLIPSSKELEKWFKSSGVKRFCKRAKKIGGCQTTGT